MLCALALLLFTPRRRFKAELRAFIALPQADYERISAELCSGRED